MLKKNGLCQSVPRTVFRGNQRRKNEAMNSRGIEISYSAIHPYIKTTPNNPYRYIAYLTKGSRSHVVSMTTPPLYCRCSGSE